jgi:hypothetical protein
MDNQPPVPQRNPAEPQPQYISGATQNAQPVGITPPSLTKPKISKAKRIMISIFGGLLTLLALSIVQGQVSHGFDIPGIVMILVFGVPGLVLLYSGIFKKN